jgi:acetyl esterase/lipase
VSADLVLPAGSGAPPVVVLVHGGGWRVGSRTDYARWARTLAGAGIAALSIDYRLAAPGAPSWPAALDDVVGAFAFVRAHGHALGVDAERIGVLATSAGAHLSAAAVLSADTGVAAAVLVNGVYDLRAQAARGAPDSVGGLIGASPQEAPATYAAASPAALAGTTGRAAGLSWTLVYGERDPVVPPAQSETFAAVLRGLGADVRTVPVPEETHHWNTTTPVDEGTNLVIRDLVLDRLGRALGGIDLP